MLTLSPSLWLSRLGVALLGALVTTAVCLGQAPAPVPPTDGVLFQTEPMEKEPQGKKNPEGSKPEPPPEAGAPALPAAPAEPKPAWYSVFGQGTVISQGNWKFRSPYEGQHSLLPLLSYRTTETATLFLDTRLWEGADFVFNPEISGGEGLSGTFGLGGFPNGEATRVGNPLPTPYVARAFLRQTFSLDGDTERVEALPNQLAGTRDIDRITVSIGKMAATDLFDDNRYSHDPRTQFLNWSLMYNGAWDYPANVRGYTYGGTVDFNTRYLAFRYGVFAEPTVAQGAQFDPHFLKANGHILETDVRYEWDDHPGVLRVWGFLNHAHMGKYREALAEMPVDPDVTLTRAYRIKYGFGLSWEQELTRDLGLFVRAGWDDGQSESWAFTEIDRTAAVGLSLAGSAWRRPQDTVGVAFVANGLSDAHKDYLASGGIGFEIGDGALRYGLEEIVELYYNWEIKKGINLAADLQGVNNPAYNQDRGPVAILAVRAHFAY